MTDPTVYEALQEEIAGLPEPLAEEALDFVRFMKARYAEASRAAMHPVEESRIQWRCHLGDVANETLEEWEGWEELISGEG